MREHLYRAKRKNWRELLKEEWWVEGLPSYDINGNITEFEVYKGFANCETIEIEQDTVCEYTGLTDKSGRKIFEGDICKDGDNVVRVLWNDKHQWGVEISKTDNVLSKGLIFPLWQYGDCEENGYRTFEVFGNIFDNPDLLKEGKS